MLVHALPYVIFDTKGMNYEWMGPWHMIVIRRVAGKTSLETCSSWQTIIAGYSTHYKPDTIKLNGVIMMCLPPHTTHESQPLVASVFKPLK